MEIPEPIETINKRLLDFFGKFENGEPRYRVVWSEDEIEKVMTNFTKEGFMLPYEVLSEVPKYRQYIHNKYILERLVPVPAISQRRLCDKKLSYEPLWVFEDNNGNALPPKWQVITILLDSIHKQMTEHRGPYTSGDELNQTTEALEERAKKLAEALGVNETSVTDSLSWGSAVGYGTQRRGGV